MERDKSEGSITTWIKPDVEQGKAVFRVDEFLTGEMGIIAGEMMTVTLKGDKLIIQRVTWFDK